MISESMTRNLSYSLRSYVRFRSVQAPQVEANPNIFVISGNLIHSLEWELEECEDVVDSVVYAIIQVMYLIRCSRPCVNLKT